MNLRSVAIAVCALTTWTTHLPADLIPVATTSGTLAVHYDADNPSQASYYQLQLSPTNTNGAALSFAAPYQSIFGDVGQFGLSVIYVAPTNDQTVPTLTAVDYNGTGPVPSAEPITWAVNDYKPGTPIGPGNASNIPYNSLFRGPSIDITSSSLTTVGTVDTLTVSGDLISDGNINWFNPAAGTTSLASLGLSNVFEFTATFTDDTSTDPGLNFFSGTATIDAETVPEPGTFVLLMSGLVGLMTFAVHRRRHVSRP